MLRKASGGSPGGGGADAASAGGGDPHAPLPDPQKKLPFSGFLDHFHVASAGELPADGRSQPFQRDGGKIRHLDDKMGIPHVHEGAFPKLTQRRDGLGRIYLRLPHCRLHTGEAFSGIKQPQLTDSRTGLDGEGVPLP